MAVVPTAICALEGKPRSVWLGKAKPDGKQKCLGTNSWAQFGLYLKTSKWTF